MPTPTPTYRVIQGTGRGGGFSLRAITLLRRRPHATKWRHLFIFSFAATPDDITTARRIFAACRRPRQRLMPPNAYRAHACFTPRRRHALPIVIYSHQSRADIAWHVRGRRDTIVATIFTHAATTSPDITIEYVKHYAALPVAALMPSRHMLPHAKQLRLEERCDMKEYAL